MRGTIGGYSILNEIGSGTFGTVFRAYDPSNGQVVALKTLNSGAELDRFRREGLMLRAIDDENVISLLAVGEDDIRLIDVGKNGDPYVVREEDDVPYIVMELMQLSLADVLASGKLSLSRSLDACLQTARGLAAVHNIRVVHRDIKPQNILIDGDGKFKVADFGIARAEVLPDLTRTGWAIGTDRYMSPEQSRDSKRVDERSDVYSLGVTLWEMLTGKAYDGQSAKSSRDYIPDSLERIINKCIEMDRERRYHTMGELIQEIANPALVNRCALIDFYEATSESDEWERKDNWLTDAPLDDWYGVTANRDGVVTEIDLSENNLQGEIPSEIAHLTELNSLRLYGNCLLANIPPEIGNLINLRFLGLTNNHLSGSIPPEIGNLTNLRELHLDNNRLSGSIPPEIGGLTNLTHLCGGGNRLSGNIPPEMGNMTKLEWLELHYNRLTGSIPPEIGNLTRLGLLELYHNRLSGNIPPELGDLPKLTSLSLIEGNNWTGCIPKAVFNILRMDRDEVGLPICDDR